MGWRSLLAVVSHWNIHRLLHRSVLALCHVLFFITTFFQSYFPTNLAFLAQLLGTWGLTFGKDSMFSSAEAVVSFGVMRNLEITERLYKSLWVFCKPQKSVWLNLLSSVIYIKYDPNMEEQAIIMALHLPKKWYTVSSSPHLGHSGSVRIFITVKCLFKAMCPVSKPVHLGTYVSCKIVANNVKHFVITSSTVKRFWKLFHFVSHRSATKLLRNGEKYYSYFIAVSTGRKNFQNWLTADEIIVKSSTSHFFWDTVYKDCRVRLCDCDCDML